MNSRRRRLAVSAERAKDAIRRWWHGPKAAKTLAASAMFVAFVFMAIDQGRSKTVANGWMPGVGFAVAPAVWLALLSQRIRDHADSIRIVLAGVVVVSTAMLGLAENKDDVGVAMFGSLGGVTLGIWFAHRAVVKERLRYEREVDGKLQQILARVDHTRTRPSGRRVAGSRRRTRR